MALFTGQDVELTCSDCGAKFIFTQGESKFFDEQGFLEPPKRCKPCRVARKAAKAQNQAFQQQTSQQQPVLTVGWGGEGPARGRGYDNDNRGRNGRNRRHDDDNSGNY